MTFIRKIVFSSCCLVLLVFWSQAEPCRGITPLRSTKAHVIRLLGEPSAATDKLLTYRFANETVFVSLITGETPTANLRILKPSTVSTIQVIPKNQISFTDLGLDEGKVVFVKGSKPGFQGFDGYVDEAAGIIVRRSGVPTIFYFANAKDRYRCPGCVVDPQSIADIPTCILCPIVAIVSPNEVQIGENAVFACNVSVGSPPP